MEQRKAAGSSAGEQGRAGSRQGNRAREQGRAARQSSKAQDSRKVQTIANDIISELEVKMIISF